MESDAVFLAVRAWRNRRRRYPGDRPSDHKRPVEEIVAPFAARLGNEQAAAAWAGAQQGAALRGPCSPGLQKLPFARLNAGSREPSFRVFGSERRQDASSRFSTADPQVTVREEGPDDVQVEIAVLVWADRLETSEPEQPHDLAQPVHRHRLVDGRIPVRGLGDLIRTRG